MELVDNLTSFGLTRQEASIYLTLQTEGELTGYEVAKLTGISRSGTYTALAGLVEKGAAFVEISTATKYTPETFENFSRNFIKELVETQQKVIKAMPARKQDTDGYITIRGRRNIVNKLQNMLEETKERVYLSVPDDVFPIIEENLKKLISEHKKVVLLTNSDFAFKGATIYYQSGQNNQVRLIVDSHDVLTGRFIDSENCTCLYSKNQNLVDVFKEMLKNEITLISLGNS